MKTRLLLGLLACVACQSPDSAPTEAETQLPGSDFEGPAFEFEQVREDVYQARGTGTVAVGANAAIIINDDDVLVVDSHISPAAAASLIDELRSIVVAHLVAPHSYHDVTHSATTHQTRG